MQAYYVYLIKIEQFSYYGITKNIKKRKLDHCRHISRLIRTGDYKKSIQVTGALYFHHKVAQELSIEAFITSVKMVEQERSFFVVYSSNDINDCAEVETFLINKSLMSNKYCCNIKIN